MENRLVAICCLVTLLALQPAMASTKVGGVTLEQTISVGDTPLSYNGAGIRKKLFFKLYVSSLYLTDALNGAGAADILEADETMLIQLNILSDLLTRDKMIKAMKDGFKKSTGSNTAPIENEITTMIDSLSQPIRPGDVYQIYYTSASGTQIILDGETIATIPGMPFKKAIFGIWLSDSPVQRTLKGAMLGA